MGSKRELLITLGADTSTFAQKIRRAKDLTKELDSNFKLLSSSNKNFQNTSEGVAKKQALLNDKIQVATSLTREYNEKIKDQQECLNNCEADVERLKQKLEDLKEAQNNSADQAEWDAWQKEIVETEKELHAVEKDVEKYTTSVTRLTTQLNQNKINIQGMNGELAETKVKLQHLERDKTFDKMSKDIDDADREFTNAKNSVVNFGNCTADLTYQQQHLSQQMSRTNKLMDEYQKDIDSSTKETKQLDTVIENLEKEFKQLDQAVRAMDGTEDNFEDMSNELEQVRGELTSANKLMDIHKQRIEKMTNSYRQSENSLNQMEGELKGVQQQLKQFNNQTQFQTLERALKSVRSEFDILDARLNVIRSSYLNFENSLVGAIREHKNLKQQITVLRNEYNLQHTAIQKYEQKLVDLTTKYDSVGKEAEQLRQKLKTLTEGSEDWNKTILKLGELEKEFNELDQEIEEVTSDLNQMRVESANTLTSMNNNIQQQHRHWEVLGSKIQTAGRTITSVGNGIRNVGMAMTPITAGLTAFGKSVMNTGSSFEESMSKVQALSGASGTALQELTDTARNLAKETTFSATQASEGLQYLSLAGYDVADSMKALPIILDSAKAGSMDLATCSDLATDALGSLGDNSELTGSKVENLNELMNQVAHASTASNMSMEDTLKSFIKVGGQVENMKIPLSTANTMLGILADRGIKAEEAKLLVTHVETHDVKQGNIGRG